MCGIAGIISADHSVDFAALQRMTDALQHRGPDGEGHWRGEQDKILLGHRRLAILDLSNAGIQPMHYNERFVVVHNGEIYNFEDLRKQCLKKGMNFKSKTDTEVIPAWWSLFHKNALREFDGMFAFALWDSHTKELFLARDRYGEKPLYYHIDHSHKTLAFASEIKALQAFGVTPTINPVAMLQFIGAGIVTTCPEKTYYENILQVPPGHVLKFSLATGAITIEPFFDQQENMDEQVLSKKDFLIQWEEVIRARMQSDVPIGTSLSGGLDSSSIVAMIGQLKDLSPLYSHQSFTAVFNDFEKNESDNARIVAQQFNLTAHYIEPTTEEFSEEIDAFIVHHEEPIQSASVYAQYKVFEAAKKYGIKVMLDGQGADELLAGYTQYWPWYFQELIRKGAFQKYLHERKQSLPNNSFKNSLWIDCLASFFPVRTAHFLELKTRLRITQNNILHPDFKKEYAGHLQISKPIIRNLNDLLKYHTFQSKLPELLRYADKNSMAQGVEVRLPFLANKLSHDLLRLPPNVKLKDGYTKWLLRSAMNEKLPSQIVWNKTKIGFEPPQLKWMSHPVVQEKIARAKKNLVEAHVLSPKVLNRPIHPHHAYDPKGLDWRFLIAGTLIK